MVRLRPTKPNAEDAEEISRKIESRGDGCPAKPAAPFEPVTPSRELSTLTKAWLDANQRHLALYRAKVSRMPLEE